MKQHNPTPKSLVKIFINSKQVNAFLESQSNESTDEQFVYFARYGTSFDGHTLALKVIRSQNYIVGEVGRIQASSFAEAEKEEILQSKFFVPTSSVAQALNDAFQRQHLKMEYHPTSIGVTGTSGKTSIVQIAGQVLNTLNQNKTLKIGTLGIEIGEKIYKNSHQTTPDYPAFINALQHGKDGNLTHLVMEVSSHGLVENRLYDYQFDVAVFTNFSQDHLDFHKSMEEYFQAKTLLFSQHLKETGAAIICAQSEKWLEMLAAAANSSRTLYLLINEKNIENCLKAQPFVSHFKNAYFLLLSDEKSDFEGISGTFKLLDSNQNLITSHTFQAKLIGEVNFENVMATFCICHASGFRPDEFVPLFKKIQGIPGRMQPVRAVDRTSKKPFVIVDYSHKPGALESALKMLRHFLKSKQKLISVFGCGGDRDASKRAIMGEISAKLADVTILTSDNPRTEDPQKIINEIRVGIPKETCCYEEPDRYLAIQKAFKIAQKSDIILIAGKGHETVQIIGTQKKAFSDAKVASQLL